MSDLPNCPQCDCDYAYEDRDLMVCPDCGHEWTLDEAWAQNSAGDSGAEGGLVVLDAGGNRLADGDSVTIIKDLKVKGSSSVVKVGTKVKNIRLTEGDHNLDCKVPGIGAVGLKSEFVRKA